MYYSTNRVHCTSAPFHRKFGGSSKPVQWLCRSVARHYFAAFAAAVRADEYFAVHSAAKRKSEHFAVHCYNYQVGYEQNLRPVHWEQM